MSGVLLFYALGWLFWSFGLVSLTAVRWVCLEWSYAVDGSGLLCVPVEAELACWLIFVSGGVKLALFPFHGWLCKVHVESSTVGSVLLAGVALKTGFYLHCLLWSLGGFICLGRLSEWLMILLLVGSWWSCWALFFQVDVKRWIALFSVSHMNLFYLGAVSCCCEGGNLSSSFWGVLLFGMVCHSLVSGGLFFLVGWLADLCGSRAFWEVSSHGVNGLWFCLLVSLLLVNGGYPGFMLFCYEVLAFTWVSAWGMQLLLFVVVCSGTSLVSGLLTAVKFLVCGSTASGLLVELLVCGLVIVLLGSGLGSILCLSWLV
jgi:NADH:ubiquinone oxidoreductase subunit 4 (subunit M)